MATLGTTGTTRRRAGWRTLVAGLAALAALTSATLAGTAPAYADPSPAAGPPKTSFLPAFLASLAAPDQSPPGANDDECRPSAAHPRPVVLVHGTIENAYSNWAELSPKLVAQGYCVFALNYGAKPVPTPPGNPFKGTEDLAASAAQLRTFVDSVLRTTGARKVDIVGHSQGGMMPRYYLKYLGGASKVNALVALAPSNYGTLFYGVLPLIAALPGGEGALSFACRACAQQRQGSDFLRDLNAGGDTVPGVRYTSIATIYDQVVMPFTNSYLRSPGVTNINLQRRCPLDASEHLGISYSSNAHQLVSNALDPANAQPLTCRPVLPLG